MTGLDKKILDYIRNGGPATAGEVAVELDMVGVYAVQIDQCVSSNEWFVYDDTGRIHITNKVSG